LVAGSTAREIRLCADESRSRSKLIKGNPGKRALGSEPQLPQRLEQVPEPPAFLLPEAEAEWKQVAPEIGGARAIDRARPPTVCCLLPKAVAALSRLSAFSPRAAVI
jgi:hypothetical protein